MLAGEQQMRGRFSSWIFRDRGNKMGYPHIPKKAKQKCIFEANSNGRTFVGTASVAVRSECSSTRALNLAMIAATASWLGSAAGD